MQFSISNRQWQCLIFLFFLAPILVLNSCSSTRKTADSAKAADIKNLLDSKRYVFKAESVMPMGRRTRFLTTDYGVKIRKDTLESYLPYFGRAYSAPMDPSQNSLSFTSTNFDYKTEEKRNGWYVIIAPRDAHQDVRQLALTVTYTGQATLMVTSNNREPISFNGYIAKITK